MRPLGVAGDQGLPPGIEAAVEFVEQGRGLAVEGLRLVLDVHLGVLAGERAQFLGLALDLGEALFEVEIGLHAAGSVDLCGHIDRRRRECKPMRRDCARAIPGNLLESQVFIMINPRGV